MHDTSRIHALVRAARRRLRLQSALAGATLALVPASALVLVLVFLVRVEVLGEEGAGYWLSAAALAVVGLGALVGGLRRFPTALVATRLDRAAGLADRLANACAFEELLAALPPGEVAAGPGEDETVAMMRAAVADAARLAPRADVAAATPFSWPSDSKAAAAFAVVATIIACIAIEPPARAPVTLQLIPVAAPRKASIDLTGLRLCGVEVGTLERDGTCPAGSIPRVFFGNGPGAQLAQVVTARPDRLVVRVPASAPIGKTVVIVAAGARGSRPFPFEVLRDGDRRYQPANRVALADDDLAFTRDLLDDLRQTAEQTNDTDLKTFADHIEALLDQADKGELSKEQLLEELAKAEKKYMDGATEEQVEQALAELEKTGKELAKDSLTKPIGEALEKGDLAKAQEEMKKLAEQLAKGELNDKERAKAADALEKAAKAFDKRDQAKQKAADQKLAKTEAEIDKLEQKLADAKSEPEKERLRKQLDDKKKQAEQQREQNQQDKQDDRPLKRLHRNMKKAAEDMRKDQSQPESRRQASRTMEDMARDTGKVDSDKRKVANQQKVRSQLDDLKEAMRRAKKGGAQGAKDRFGRNKRNQDFGKRARGGKGSRSAWKPGQGKPGGKGQGQQPGGQGQQPGGDSYGDGHDPDLMGDPTAKSGKTQDQDLQGVHGKGPSTRETILSAAQKGFSSQSYKQVYGRYKTIVEEVINSEKVPSGYKFYVKKYFQKIKPHAM